MPHAPSYGHEKKPPQLSGATSATVTGTGTAGGRTFVFTGTASVSGGTITLSNVQSDIGLPDTIDYLNRLEISWVLTPNGGQLPNCTQLVTKHRVYVLLEIPVTGALYETVINIGCNNGIGKNNDVDAVSAIWTEFTDQDVRRKPKDGFNNPDGGGPLTYWSPTNPAPQPDCWTTSGLLNIGDGRCGAWADFLYEILRAQGIATSVKTVVNPPPLVSQV